MENVVSIIVPVYNLANEIDKCLTNLFQQTYSKIQIILVDDGSSDDSLKIMQSYKQENLLILHQHNQGAAAARNFGLKHAIGEYVAFIDGDDWIDNNFVELMVNKLEETASDLVVCDYVIEPYDQSESEVISLQLDTSKLYCLANEPYILNHIGNAPWNKLYRRDLIVQENIIFPEGYRHHDLAFTQHYLIVAKKIAYLNQPLNHYLKDRPNNISTAYDHKIRHIIVMLDYVLSKYHQYDLLDKCYLDVEFLAIANLIVSLRKLKNIEQKKFANEYINEVYTWLNKHFPKYQQSTYFHQATFSDLIYRQKWTVKLFYQYSKLKKKIGANK